MRVIISNNCVGCGACSEIGIEVFDIWNDYAIVNPYKVEGREDICIDAALICPVCAIKIII